MASINDDVQSQSQSRLSAFWKQLCTDFAELFARSATNGDSLYTALDGLRALAVLWVVAVHIMMLMTGPLTPYSHIDSLLPPQTATDVWNYLVFVSSGDMGVDIFFVLSGFLIADILIRDFAKRRLSAWTFLYRRFVRIVPAYFVVILFYMLGATLEEYDTEGCRANWWKNVLFVNNVVSPLLIHVPDDTTSACIPQTWSIAVEFQFYLISPALILCMMSASTSEWRRAFAFGSSPSVSHDAESPYVALHDRTTSAEASQISSEPLTAAEVSACIAHHFGRKMLGLIAIGVLSLSIQAILYATHLNFRDNQILFYVYTTNHAYVRTYCRVSPYLAGIACALYFHAFGKDELKRTLAAAVDEASNDSSLFSRFDRNSCIIFVTVVVNIVVAYLGSGLKSLITGQPTDLLSAGQLFLSFFSRLIFGCCLAYQVYLCLVGRGQLLNRILSSELWLPFARLSYSVYLTQFIFISWFFTWKSHIPSLAFHSDWSSGQAYIATLLVLLVFTVLMFAMVSPLYLLVEKTCMRLR
jgi:peptidoglycan/LPS O-acetylase OafA/YrhL